MVVCNNLLQSPKLLNSLSVITFFFFLVIPYSTPLYFNFSSFGPDDTNRSITITGNASISNEGIQLTQDPNELNGSLSNWNTGRATYFEPLHLWDQASGTLTDFTTHFSFVIKNADNSDLGEGFAFFLAPNGSGIPPNATGGRLGLESMELPENRFVAVEFDTYRNEWEPRLPVNHVGIDINSTVPVEFETWNTIFWIIRAHEAWINYNSSSNNLSVVFTSYNNDDTVTSHGLYYIVDLRNFLPEWVTFGFSASTSEAVETNNIKSWEFNANFPGENNTNVGGGNKINVGLVVGVSVGSCVLVGVLALVGFVWWKKRTGTNKRTDELFIGSSMDDEFEKGRGPKKFQYGELARATSNFAEDQKLGEGGFGGVYRGFLRELNSYVAVKRVSKGSKQGIKEYASEVKIISQLRHRNLVQLIGWCHEKGELLLVYEYMENGSLDAHLFKQQKLLTWELRYKIAQGLASALLYLHEEWEQGVVHRDIKSSNVMLDSNFNAKLGDFGLARLVDHENGSSTTDIAGTLGYMAIEYFVTGKATKESDVYSFGVVALEIACGRKPSNFGTQQTQISMVEWVWDLHGKGNILEAADPKLCANFDKEQMERLMIVGLWCAHPDYNLRPSIRQALLVLNSESPLPNLPSTMPSVTASFGARVNMPPSSFSSSNGANTTRSNKIQNSSNSYNTSSSEFATSSEASSRSASVLITK